MAAPKKITSPSVEEVAVLKADTASVARDPGYPAPDRPYTDGPTDLMGDPGHVNPALEPAPIWTPKERPAPVPVINDPGLLGSQPSLQELNAAATGTSVEQNSDFSAEAHQEAIRVAAETRLKRLAQEAKDAATDARKRITA